MVKLFPVLPLVLSLPLQNLGAGSDLAVRVSFVETYSCGVEDTLGRILECYDLGNNVFSTRPSKDTCALYSWEKENGFRYWASFPHCMDSLLKPVSSGQMHVYVLDNKLFLGSGSK